jgi:hypothetical protein
LPDHGGELDGDLLSVKHSVFAGWEEQPQPAPPGCGPIHFIHFIEAAVNAGLTFLKDCPIITTL